MDEVLKHKYNQVKIVFENLEKQYQKTVDLDKYSFQDIFDLSACLISKGWILFYLSFNLGTVNIEYYKKSMSYFLDIMSKYLPDNYGLSLEENKELHSKLEIPFENTYEKFKIIAFYLDTLPSLVDDYRLNNFCHQDYNKFHWIALNAMNYILWREKYDPMNKDFKLAKNVYIFFKKLFEVSHQKNKSIYEENKEASGIEKNILYLTFAIDDLKAIALLAFLLGETEDLARYKNKIKFLEKHMK